MNDAGEVESRSMISSYEDAYTAELIQMHECFSTGKKIKTTAEDALQDLKLYDMMYQTWGAS